MWKLKPLASILLVCAWSLVSAKPQRYDSYNYQGAEVHRWQDMEPYFNFQSHRLSPVPKVRANYPPPPIAPPIIHHDLDSFEFPQYDSKDYDYSQAIPFIPSRPRPKYKDFNITKERMGGFGGTGDTHGYGAYEYKPVDNSLFETSFNDFFKSSKSKKKNYDVHPLQRV